MTPTREQLGSPCWRLSNLYSIMSASATGEDAGIIPFRPTPEQLDIIEAVYVRREEFIVVVKSRQLGLSTVVCLIILDALLFGSGIQASIVDQTADDAEKKLNQKIKLAYSALPEWLRAGWKVTGSNDSEFTVRLNGKADADNRSCFAGLRARGGTNHILFISEWGEIQLKDKRRSLEILTGAVPSADHPGCITLAETTWKGGRTGELWPIVSQALQMRGQKLQPKDPRVYFFAWFTDPSHRDEGSHVLVTEKTHEYFDNLEVALSRKFDNGQRLWWQKRKQKFGVMMSSEHPSTLEEALESPHQSAFFDGPGLTYQESLSISLEPEIKYGDIIVQENGAAYWRETTREQAIFRRWDDRQPGESYIQSVDFCIGRQAAGTSGDRDTNAFAVWRAGKTTPQGRVYPPKMVCACMPDDRSGTVETIRRVHALHLYYGACMVVPEINGKDDIALRLQAAGVSRIWAQRTGADGAMPGKTRQQEVLGWITSGSAGGTRKQILDHLQELVLQQDFVGSCRTLAHQLSVFIRDDRGIPAAASGEHDDWVMSSAIALFTMPSATVYTPIGQRAAALVGVGGWRNIQCLDA